MNILFDNLESLIDALNGIEKTRELILQLAVQGKLTEQDPKDESASELLKKIKKEKEKLIAEGKIRKQNDVEPINSDEITFQLPKGWLFEKIGNVFFTTSGGTPSRGNFAYWNGTIPWLKSGELNDDTNISKTEEFITKEGLKNSSAKLFEKGSVVIALYGATAGKVGILGVDTTTNQAVCNFYKSSFILNTYLFYFLKANRTKILQECFGGAQPNISQDYVKKMVFALPPLAEQKRIVEKVNNLMALLDELEEKKERRNQKRIKLNNASLEKLLTSKDDKKLKTNWKRIEENFSTLYSVSENVEKLKQAILQLAVQGKLVKQDSKDEPASELLKKIKKEKDKLIAEGKIKKQNELPPIKDEERPFELPNGWEWVRLGNVTKLITDGTHLTPNYTEKGRMFLSAQNVRPFRFLPYGYRHVSEEDYQNYIKNKKAEYGDILIVRVGAGIGDTAVIDQDLDFAIYVSLGLIKIFERFMDSNYAALLFNSPFGREQSRGKTLGIGVSQGNLNLNLIRTFLFSLPPIQEQKRIVEKVNQLMSLCNALAEKLTKKEATAEKLVSAVVNRVSNRDRKTRNDKSELMKEHMKKYDKVLI